MRREGEGRPPAGGGVRSGDRAAVPVVGIVLLVAVTVVLVGMVGAMTFELVGDPTGEPQFTAVSVERVETSDDGLHVPAADNCEHTHLVITLSHTAGEALDPSELAYVVEAVGDQGTRVSWRNDVRVVPANETITAGNEFELLLDADSTHGHCDAPGIPERPNEPDQRRASPPDGAGPPGGHGPIHETFLADDSDETLIEVRLRIIHRPSESVIVDRTIDDIGEGD